MIKRLQTNISGKEGQGQYKFKAPPLTYGGYYAGMRIAGLPPNALLSNKFIEPPSPPGPSVIELDFAEGSYYPAPVTISPPSSVINFRFIKVGGLMSGPTTIVFSDPSYDFTGTTMVMTDPTINAAEINYPNPPTSVNVVMNSDLSSYTTFEVTLTLANGPVSSIESINFQV